MEIERKWIVDTKKLPFELKNLPKKEIEQYYISFEPVIRLRSIDGREFVLTVKSRGEGYSRQEFEMNVDRVSYENLKKKREGIVLKKNRYCRLRPDGLTEEIDIFEGELEGLCYLEIEFPCEEDAKKFEPDYENMREVTFEKGCTNAELARRYKLNEK